MATSDLEVYIQERLLAYDPNIDVTPGSPADTQIVQPILRRLGSDPFTVDIATFLQAKLNQEFPTLPTKEGDAITDLLIKTSVVLFDPLVRENTRVKNNLSFSDPAILTTEEADALGANLFAQRITGDYAKGRARIYFAQPQSANVSPSNYFTSKTDLHFFPTDVQSIRVDEMLFNVEGSLYYFDVNVIAENPGDQYNIEADSLVTVANLTSAVRVKNKTRFRSGVAAETAEEFIVRAEQELTERSAVTVAGATAQLTKAFPELTRLAIVGTNDPEMQRDVVTGGGLGALLGGGTHATTIADGEAQVTTRRVRIVTDAVDFTALIGATGEPVSNFVLTLFGGYPVGASPTVRDLTVRAVVDATTLDVNEQVMAVGGTGLAWGLRKKTLTIDNIPGGLLFPTNADGTSDLPSNQVHIGGVADVYVRGAELDTNSLLLSDVVDDAPLLSGLAAQSVNAGGPHVSLSDLVLGVNYSVGDATYNALRNALLYGYTLQLLDPPVAGSYRVIDVVQTPSASPLLKLSPDALVVAGNYRWRLLDVLDVDLEEPKETRVSGSDLQTVQGVDVVTTAGATDFNAYGVSIDDILRIKTGNLVVGDYVVKALPTSTSIRVDRVVPATVNAATYSVFRKNAAGGLLLPLVRIDSIDLLDTTGQPVGSKVPYALPIDVQSRSFANAAHGIKADLTDVRLGIVTQDLPSGASVNTLTMTVQWDGQSPFTVVFSGSNPISAASIVTQINAAAATATATAGFLLAQIVDTDRVGLLAVGTNVQVTGGTALTALFGASESAPFTSRQIRSTTINADGGWTALRPALDLNFDVAQVLDGLQIGFYDQLTVGGTAYSPLTGTHDFAPEARRHVQVGARSLGSVRMYFLDPTSVEVDTLTRFTLLNSDGTLVRYFPDPAASYQRIPALPSGAKPKDGSTSGTVLTSASNDFIKSGIQAGDSLRIDYVPITGTTVLADPVPALALTTVIVSIDGGLDKTVVLVNDDNTIASTAVTRAGVATQINTALGRVVCSITAANHLEFEADASIVIRGSGTANTILGLPLTDTSNDSPNKGSYAITAVGQTTLTVGSSFTSKTRQQFKVFRPGLQRIVSTQMAKNVGTTGLYYFDVVLVSEGTGDAYNIQAAQQLTASAFRSDGYYITTADKNLTFSVKERPTLRISRSILDVGVSDDPNNATQLSGQNLQINYERSALTEDVQNFSLSETERVIVENPLARHLIPYFVRLDISYSGGSSSAVVTPDVLTYINGLDPNAALEASDLNKILSNHGATVITNPLDLIAVVHNVDRTITVERSQDKLNTGRLAAFIPDVVTLTRKVG